MLPPQIRGVHVRAAPQRRLDDALVAVLRAYYCDGVAVHVTDYPQARPCSSLSISWTRLCRAYEKTSATSASE